MKYWCAISILISILISGCATAPRIDRVSTLTPVEVSSKKNRKAAGRFSPAEVSVAKKEAASQSLVGDVVAARDLRSARSVLRQQTAKNLQDVRPLRRHNDFDSKTRSNKLRVVAYQQNSATETVKPIGITADQPELTSPQDSSMKPDAEDLDTDLDLDEDLDAVPKTAPTEDLFRYSPTDWTGVSFEEILQLAFQCHPTIAKAQARLDALQGRFIQKGLPNNPSIGVVGSDLNQDGKLNRVGAYVGRKVVRNGKLQSDQAIVSAEIETARQQLKTAQQRLSTDVEQQFYDVLVAQEQVHMARRLAAVAGRAVEVSKELYAAQEVARTAVLQSELALERANVSVQRLLNQHVASTRKLAALIGEESLPTMNVAGRVDQFADIDGFESSYDQLLKNSPALSALFADIERARRVASRQRLEVVSDLNWQTTFEYDTEEDNVIGGFQVTWQIPVLNQNQGAIYEAEREVMVAQHTANTKVLQLRQQLALAYEQYIDAQLQKDAFEKSILPKSAMTLGLLLKGYAAGETELLEVLSAQRTFFQTHVAWLENVRTLRRQNAKIRGLLLADSLSSTP